MININPGRSGVETPYHIAKTNTQSSIADRPCATAPIARSLPPLTTSPRRA